MSDKRIVVIMNPAASRGATSQRRDQVANLLSAANLKAEIIETTTPGKAIATGEQVPGSGSYLAAEAIRQGANIIVAAGGDGTVGEVANGVVGTDATLAVLPMGTGNDFARTLGFGTNLDQAIQTIADGEPRKIDLGKGPGGYFINIAGCGFDAEVAHRINHGFRRLSGTTAYIAAVLQTLAAMRPVPITLTIDGKEHQEKVMLCAIANAKTYGGGMRIAPTADITDGLFDTVVIGNVNKFDFMRTFPKVFSGDHVHHPKVKVLQGRHVRIESEHVMPVLADGEELGSTPAEFEVYPGAISVLTPKSV